jgi:hypothetical protein
MRFPLILAHGGVGAIALGLAFWGAVVGFVVLLTWNARRVTKASAKRSSKNPSDQSLSGERESSKERNA